MLAERYRLCFAAIIDLFSRRVVGWSMKTETTAQLVTDALILAVWRRGKPNLLSIKPAAGQERKVGRQRNRQELTNEGEGVVRLLPGG